MVGKASCATLDDESNDRRSALADMPRNEVL
jgi:hypothetical protein